MVESIYASPFRDEPPHPVVRACRHRNSRIFHLGNACRREEHLVAVTATTQVHGQVVTHVLGRRDDVPVRDLVAQVGSIKGHREAEPVAVASRHPSAPGLFLRSIAMPHIERLEDVLLDVHLIRLLRNRLDQQPQDHIVGIRVVEGGAHRTHEFGCAKISDRLLQRLCLGPKKRLRPVSVEMPLV